MALSEEQITAVNTLQKEDTHILLISAVAGSGKTFTLTQAANSFNNNLYLAYNKSAEVDAQTKFGPGTLCKTIHGLAYTPIIKLGLSMPGIPSGPRTVDFFNYRSIDIPMSYDDKLEVIDEMNRFCMSEFTSIQQYLSTYSVAPHIGEAVTTYIQKMAKKQIPSTHSFYLKYFHILLSRGVLAMPTYDLIMLDECQDSPAVTLEIFKLLQANKKIGVGDIQQSIYSFNHCVNGFEYLQNEADHILHLTKSFRCSTEIANKVQKFCRKHLDPKLNFTGTDSKDDTIKTTLYIARTNASLIAKMLELNEHNTPYNLTRKASEIFGLLLTIISLKPGVKIYNKEFKFLLEDMDYYNAHYHLRDEYPTLLSYIASVHSADRSIAGACRLISKYGGQKIFKAFDIAKAHESANVTHSLTLSSAHAAKGMEADKVELDEDLNLDYLNSETMDYGQIVEESRLRYVAITRAKKVLLGAHWLN